MDDVEQKFRDAISLHQSGNLAEARQLYLEVIKAFPDHADALHLCGMASYQSNDSGPAEKLIRRAIDIRHDRPDYRSNLGLVLQRLGRISEAIECYESAIAMDAGFLDAHLNLGNACMADGRQTEAEAVLRHLLTIEPAHLQAMNNLAVILLARRDFLGARSLLETVLTGNAGYADARINLARVMFAAEERAAALEQLRMLAQSDASTANVLRSVAELMSDAGSAKEAIEVWRRIVELEPTASDGYVGLGAALQAAGDLPAAEQSYHDALNVNSSDARALNNLGTLFMQTEEFERALDCFQSAIDRNPVFVDAVYNRATAFLELGGLIKAEESFNEAIRLQPELAEAYRCLVNIYTATSRPDKAADLLRCWLEIAPAEPTATHLLSALSGKDVAPRASDEYVVSEFDRFAGDFDRTLKRLRYRAPEAVVELLLESMPQAVVNVAVLDAGCGTGLCGPLLRPFSRRLVGVDLSPRMIDEARRTDVYDELEVAELVEFMRASTTRYDLIVSTDTLVYFGDLQEAMAAAAATLRPGGVLSFSLERLDAEVDAGFRLNGSGRYSHRPDYVRNVAELNDFEIVELKNDVLRFEMEEPVQGFIVICQRLPA